MSVKTTTIVRKLPDGYTPTEAAIHEMMVEATGRSMLDSGDAYGRAYEKNRAIWDLKRIPAVYLSWWGPGIRDVSPVRSTFHYLAAHLVYDAAMQERYDAFDLKRDPERRQAWLGTMEAFADGIDGECGVYNTYSEETCLLDAVIQFASFQDHDAAGDRYVLLQHHGGCDMRGGYSRPRAFRVNDVDELLGNWSWFSLACECGDVYSCDGGLHLESDGLALPRGGWPARWIPDRGNRRFRCAQCCETVGLGA